MRPDPKHDQRVLQLKAVQDTFERFRTVTGAPNLLGEVLRPHLDAAAALRNAVPVGAQQAEARARRLPEQVAAGEITLDEAVAHLATIAVWTAPATPDQPNRAETLAEEAARCHEANAIQAIHEVAPHLRALLVPFARTAVEGADKAARRMTDIPGIAAYVRRSQEADGGFKVGRDNKTRAFRDASQEAVMYNNLFTLVHNTANQLAYLERRNVDPITTTYGVPPKGTQYHFVTRNVDERVRLAVAVELGWQPGYYPPDDALPTEQRKASRLATRAGAAIRAMAGAH